VPALPIIPPVSAEAVLDVFQATLAPQTTLYPVKVLGSPARRTAYIDPVVSEMAIFRPPRDLQLECGAAENKSV
jgi:hypothetical protein